MSTRGTQSLFIRTLLNNRGALSGPDFQTIVDYAQRGPLTDGEKRALLNPVTYLKTNQQLASAGIGIADIQVSAEALAQAKALAQTLGMEAFPGLAGTPPAPTPVPNQNPLAALLAAAKDLGKHEDWSVRAPGAKITFATAAADGRGGRVAGFVLEKPQWQDPAPRELITENMAAFRALKTASDLGAFLTKITQDEADYFDAKGVTVGSNNERFGIQGLRRAALVAEVRKSLGSTALTATEKKGVGLALLQLGEGLISGRTFHMDTGSHTNYWPYWNNYVGALLKVYEQTAPGTDAYRAIENRISDIYRHKTVFTSWSSDVKEEDMETSLRGAVVFDPPFVDGPGFRVSLTKESRPEKVRYELLTVGKQGLPESLKGYAGAPVYRDGDKLMFDDQGDVKGAPTPGEALPDGLAAHIESAAVPGRIGSNGQFQYDHIGYRPLRGSERPRKGISADWNQNGRINAIAIDISWWGHCHVEAPLNNAGFDPRKPVTLYRADRGVPADRAERVYSAEDIWDLGGSLAADPLDAVGAVTFVGDRNNGGHHLTLTLDGGRRRIQLDAEVTELWHKSDPNVQYDDPMRRFRRDIENDDGTFGINPDWLASGSAEGDRISVDALGRRLTVQTTSVTLDARGNVTESKRAVKLDPKVDQFVLVAEELSDRGPDGGGRVMEHHYNPMTQAYRRVIIERNKADDFARKEVQTDPDVRVSALVSEQETPYDSVDEIHRFVMADLGLPFTFDTSSGKAVWNYPVNQIGVTVDRSVDKIEDGVPYHYTSYTLTYDTMGGPGDTVRYIIKRDETGRTVRALALDPMPDFAFRNDKTVAAPADRSRWGGTVTNNAAYAAGYMRNSAGSTVDALWERSAALLYASLGDATPSAGANLFETVDGRVLSFDDPADFKRAVELDQALRGPAAA